MQESILGNVGLGELVAGMVTSRKMGLVVLVFLSVFALPVV